MIKSVCEQFIGTYCKICINRFYTLMELLIELYDMSLFYTGTNMYNCAPKEIIMTNRPLQYKLMSRGGFNFNVLNSLDREVMKMLLVGWKYCYMVYCLTYYFSTRETYTCLSITQGVSQTSYSQFLYSNKTSTWVVWDYLIRGNLISM